MKTGVKTGTLALVLGLGACNGVAIPNADGTGPGGPPGSGPGSYPPGVAPPPGSGPGTPGAGPGQPGQPGAGTPGNPGSGTPMPGGAPTAQLTCPDTRAETTGRRFLRRLTTPEYENTIRAAFGLTPAEWKGATLPPIRPRSRASPTTSIASRSGPSSPAAGWRRR